MIDNPVTNCPYCKEEILAEAIKCKHCHEALKKEEEKEEEEQPGEVVLSFHYPAWHAYAWEIFLGILLLPAFGAGLILLGRVYFKRHSRKYVLMTKKIVVQNGFFTRTTESFSLGKISTMSFKQTPTQRLFKSGDVTITVPGRQIPVENIANPEQFVETINKWK